MQPVNTRVLNSAIIYSKSRGKQGARGQMQSVKTVCTWEVVLDLQHRRVESSDCPTCSSLHFIPKFPSIFIYK